MTPRLVVTIDGPAGTGKSTVAHLLAERLGLEFLDTGAMYRAAALLAIEDRIAPEDGPRLAARLRMVGVSFDWSQDPPDIRLGGRSVASRIRDPDVNEVVSIVAAQPEVRRVMVEEQRAAAASHPRLVTEGRDQGSVVFPDAEVRFYLEADAGERARRRVEQLHAQGRPADLEGVVAGIRERDRIDSTRADSPLRVPDGAIRIDTSHLPQERVVALLKDAVESALPASILRPHAAGGCSR